MPVISSSQNPTVKLIRSLSDKKQRLESGLFVAEGQNVLDRARMLGWEPEILVSTEVSASWGKSKVLLVGPEIMKLLSRQNNPPAVLGVFRQKWQVAVKHESLWLALEDMRDPGNLGTIIRTADAVGASGIILAGHSCDPWSPECVRATMGSIFAVPLVRMTQTKLISLCQTWPGEVVGTHLQGTEDYRRSYREPLIMVMGSEGSGLSEELAAACSVLVRIPMREGSDSLNVAVATAVMLFEARRQTAMPASSPS